MESKVKKLVLAEYKLHPQATLVDYYKLFFQGTFGPAHLLFDKKKAFEYLKMEVEKNTDFEDCLWQDISYRNNFYRVNLKIVKENKISPEDFFKFFLESESLSIVPSRKAWQTEWEKISAIILRMKIPLKNIAHDLDFIRSSLRKNRLIFHHSAVYNYEYHPHYRIIAERQFKKLISLL